MFRSKKSILLIACMSHLALGACGAEKAGTRATETQSPETGKAVSTSKPILENTDLSSESAETEALFLPVENSLLNLSEMFSTRDLRQTPDLEKAIKLPLKSKTDTIINLEGIYILSGDYKETTIIIEADNKEAKVQLVLDELTIINTSAPALYIKSADKVFITTLNGRNSLSVTDDFNVDGETNTDAVIFSLTDLTLNGSGYLDIQSAEGNGISSKDDLKITGGTLNIQSKDDGLEANDSIRIAGGLITMNAGADTLHSENNDDLSLGFIYIYDGELNITAKDDALRANSLIQIDGGSINIRDSYEGLEATRIRISGGILNIYSSDDGINVAAKTPAEVLLEIYDG